MIPTRSGSQNKLRQRPETAWTICRPSLEAQLSRYRAQRLALQTHVHGVFSDSDRKSMQAMLARVTDSITYQGFQHFITHAVWDADRIWRRLLEVLPERRSVLIIDGTSFPKQGTHSVGVARQYCGALGKIANCQVAVTARLRLLYVFVVMEVGTRRIVHWNVTDHLTAEWAAQQLRMIVPGDQAHRFVIHDRDTIYSEGVDRTLEAMGLAVLKTPARVPQANTFCERLIGTIRRECLDFVIPMTERHLRSILREWIRHYNRGRPHASLGPGIPEGPLLNEHNAASGRHRLPERSRVAATPILSGLHHEYPLEEKAA